MAPFFDKVWFETSLAARGLDLGILAVAAGLDAEAMERIVKDEREVSPTEVMAFAALLGAPADEVARRCGVTTRAPRAPAEPEPSSIAALEARMARIEAKLNQLIEALNRR
jgi:GTP cyclohydrolase III